MTKRSDQPFWMMLLILGIVSIAAAPSQAQDLKSYRSRAYVIQSDLDPVQVREMGQHMDVVYAEYAKRFSKGFRTHDKRPMQLYLFKTRDGYNTFLAGLEIDGRGSGGMFFVRQGAAGLAVWFGERDRDDILATLQHEGFHQFAFMKIGSNLPIWANEGLAEYFGDAIIMRGRAVTGQADTVRLFNVQEAIKADRHIPYSKLLTMTDAEWMARLNAGGSGVGLQYDQSWSIVHFLVHGDNRYRTAFMRYLLDINRGKTSDEAYKRSFGSSAESFERAWREYMLKLEPDPLSLAVTRMRFLAQGTRWLVENDQPAPTTMEELKNQLQKHNYRSARSTHGGQLIYESRNNDMFLPPPPDRPKAEVTLTLEKNPDETLPAEIFCSGLSTPVRIIWKKQEDGRLRYEFQYQ